MIDHMLHIEKKTTILLLQFAKKLQVDIFKIVPTGRSQKCIIKKTHSVHLSLLMRTGDFSSLFRRQ